MSYLSQALETQAVSQQKATGRSIEMIFHHAMEEINRGYKAGTIAHIKATNSELWQKIIILEHTIENAWLAGNIKIVEEALKAYVAIFKTAAEVNL